MGTAVHWHSQILRRPGGLHGVERHQTTFAPPCPSTKSQPSLRNITPSLPSRLFSDDKPLKPFSPAPQAAKACLSSLSFLSFSFPFSRKKTGEEWGVCHPLTPGVVDPPDRWSWQPFQTEVVCRSIALRTGPNKLPSFARGQPPMEFPFRAERAKQADVTRSQKQVVLSPHGMTKDDEDGCWGNEFRNGERGALELCLPLGPPAAAAAPSFSHPIPSIPSSMRVHPFLPRPAKSILPAGTCTTCNLSTGW